MWNNQKYVIRNHVAKIVYDEVENGLKVYTKLSYEHIQLTHYSLMNVRLALQTLNGTEASALRRYYGHDTSETALFYENMDNFFDALNVRNKSEGDRKRKKFLKPYWNIDDPRLDSLRNVVLNIYQTGKKGLKSDRGKRCSSHGKHMRVYKF